MVSAFRDAHRSAADALFARARAGDATAFVELQTATGLDVDALKIAVDSYGELGAHAIGGTVQSFTASAGGVPAATVQQRLVLRGGVEVKPAWSWPNLIAAPGTVMCRDPSGAPRRFTIDKSLSSGNAGVTLLGHDDSGKRVVIKVPHDGDAIFDKRITTEADAYRAVTGTSKYLPELLGCGRDEKGRKILVVEFVDGGRLRSTEATRANPTKAVRIAMNLLRAVRALNEVGMRHADLCPGNVFIKDDASESVKAIDLGMAAPIHADYEWGGDPYYAPEQTAGKPSEGRANADLFSVGALLQELVTGASPTVANRALIPHVVRRVGDVDVTLASVLARALDPNPATRVQTAQELLDALRPFSS